MASVRYSRFRDEVLTLYGPGLRAKATLSKVRQVLGEFGSLPGVNYTRDLTPASVASWISLHPGRAPMTVLSLLRTFSTCCQYGLVQGYFRRSPFDFRGVNEWVRLDRGSAGKAKVPQASNTFRRIRLRGSLSTLTAWLRRVLGLRAAFSVWCICTPSPA